MLSDTSFLVVLFTIFWLSHSYIRALNCVMNESVYYAISYCELAMQTLHLGDKIFAPEKLHEGAVHASWPHFCFVLVRIYCEIYWSKGGYLGCGYK